MKRHMRLERRARDTTTDDDGDVTNRMRTTTPTATTAQNAEGDDVVTQKPRLGRTAKHATKNTAAAAANAAKRTP